MKLFFALLLLLCGGFSYSAAAQTAPAPAGAVTIGPKARFVMRNGTVVLRQDNTDQPLTKNVRLANGTKINYKSGIVELLQGKITTLREGDYVTPQGEIIFATPASAAAARGDQSSAPSAQFEPYVQVGTTSAAVQSKQLELMARKIDLLNQKISLLSRGGPQADTRSLDQQLQLLDSQLQQLK